MGMFDGILSAATGGVLDLAGGLFANRASADQASQAQAFSAAQSKQQMDFQERMRATQYQTAVEDLKAAGLNPMLAYTHGGAGTPSGSAAVGQQATITNPMKGMASSAALLGNLKADIEKKDAETTESYSRTGVNEEQRKLLDAQTKIAILEAGDVIPAKVKSLVSQSLLQDAQRTATNATEMLSKQTLQINKPEEAKAKTEWGKISPYLKDVSQGVSSASQAVNALKGTKAVPLDITKGR